MLAIVIHLLDIYVPCMMWKFFENFGDNVDKTKSLFLVSFCSICFLFVAKLKTYSVNNGKRCIKTKAKDTDGSPEYDSANENDTPVDEEVSPDKLNVTLLANSLDAIHISTPKPRTNSGIFNDSVLAFKVKGDSQNSSSEQNSSQIESIFECQQAVEEDNFTVETEETSSQDSHKVVKDINNFLIEGNSNEKRADESLCNSTFIFSPFKNNTSLTKDNLLTQNSVCEVSTVCNFGDKATETYVADEIKTTDNICINDKDLSQSSLPSSVIFESYKNIPAELFLETYQKEELPSDVIESNDEVVAFTESLKENLNETVNITLNDKTSTDVSSDLVFKSVADSLSRSFVNEKVSDDLTLNSSNNLNAEVLCDNVSDNKSLNEVDQITSGFQSDIERITEEKVHSGVLVEKLSESVLLYQSSEIKENGTVDLNACAAVSGEDPKLITKTLLLESNCSLKSDTSFESLSSVHEVKSAVEESFEVVETKSEVTEKSFEVVETIPVSECIVQSFEVSETTLVKGVGEQSFEVVETKSGVTEKSFEVVETNPVFEGAVQSFDVSETSLVKGVSEQSFEVVETKSGITEKSFEVIETIPVSEGAVQSSDVCETTVVNELDVSKSLSVSTQNLVGLKSAINNSPLQPEEILVPENILTEDTRETASSLKELESENKVSEVESNSICNVGSCVNESTAAFELPESPLNKSQTITGTNSSASSVNKTDVLYITVDYQETVSKPADKNSLFESAEIVSNESISIPPLTVKSSDSPVQDIEELSVKALIVNNKTEKNSIEGGIINKPNESVFASDIQVESFSNGGIEDIICEGKSLELCNSSPVCESEPNHSLSKAVLKKDFSEKVDENLLPSSSSIPLSVTVDIGQVEQSLSSSPILCEKENSSLKADKSHSNHLSTDGELISCEEKIVESCSILPVSELNPEKAILSDIVVITPVKSNLDCCVVEGVQELPVDVENCVKVSSDIDVNSEEIIKKRFKDESFHSPAVKFDSEVVDGLVNESIIDVVFDGVKSSFNSSGDSQTKERDIRLELNGSTEIRDNREIENQDFDADSIEELCFNETLALEASRIREEILNNSNENEVEENDMKTEPAMLFTNMHSTNVNYNEDSYKMSLNSSAGENLQAGRNSPDLNNSEAGPATAGEEFTTSSNHPIHFDLDYLTNIGQNCHERKNLLSRQSLYVKFDPLVGQVVSNTEVCPRAPVCHRTNESHKDTSVLTTPIKDAALEGEGKLIAFTPSGPSVICESPEHSESIKNKAETVTAEDELSEDSSKSGSVLDSTVQEINSFKTPMKNPSSEKKPQSPSASSSTTSQNTPKSGPKTVVSQEVYLKEMQKLQDLMDQMIVQENKYKDELESKSDQLEKLNVRIEKLQADISEKEAKLCECQKENNKLQKEVQEKTKSNKQLGLILEEYERTISQMLAQKEEEKKEFENQKEIIMKERDETMKHLNNMEIAFNDVHEKYERSKTVIEGMKNNEDELRGSLQKYEETVQKQDDKYKKLRVHAMSQLEKANMELDLLKRTHETESARLNAMVKKSEIRITSLEEALERKTKENAELTQICDELINKVSGN